MTQATAPAPVTAHIAEDFATSAARFAAAVATTGMNARDDAGTQLVTLSRGTIRAGADADRTRVTLTAHDAIGMQVLRDLLAGIAEKMAVNLDWDDKLPRGRPANLSLAQVVQSVRISPSFHRVVVAGADLGRMAQGGLHFTLPQGPAGADWPYTDEGGVTRWPEGIGAWHRPVFTTRAVTHGAQPTLTFDVFLHAGGRTPDYVARLAPGDTIALMGPSGAASPKPTRHLDIIADETAVPVAARLLAEAPADTVGRAVLFVPAEADIQDLPHPAGITVDWVVRGGDVTPVSALQSLTLPAADRFVFFAAEKAEAAIARQVLTECGLQRGEFLAASYWTARG